MLSATFIAPNVRGLAGLVVGNHVTLWASSGLNLIRFFDDSFATAPIGTVIATADANTAFRGIALAPTN